MKRAILSSLFLAVISYGSSSLDRVEDETSINKNWRIESFSTSYRTFGGPEGTTALEINYDRQTGAVKIVETTAGNSNMTNVTIKEIPKGAVDLALESLNIRELPDSYEPEDGLPIDHGDLTIKLYGNKTEKSITINDAYISELPLGIMFIYNISRFKSFWI
jgi:hypothetical protein